MKRRYFVRTILLVVSICLMVCVSGVPAQKKEGHLKGDQPADKKQTKQEFGATIEHIGQLYRQGRFLEARRKAEGQLENVLAAADEKEGYALLRLYYVTCLRGQWQREFNATCKRLQESTTIKNHIKDVLKIWSALTYVDTGQLGRARKSLQGLPTQGLDRSKYRENLFNLVRQELGGRRQPTEEQQMTLQTAGEWFQKNGYWWEAAKAMKALSLVHITNGKFERAQAVLRGGILLCGEMGSADMVLALLMPYRLSCAQDGGKRAYLEFLSELIDRTEDEARKIRTVRLLRQERLSTYFVHYRRLIHLPCC